MASGQDIVEEIVTLLENNITDVNSDRLAKSKKWIYDEIPRADVTSYPRIGVQEVTADSEWFGLGDNKERRNSRIEIQIRTKLGSKLTIDSTTHRDRQILDYLSNKVTDLMALDSTRESLLSSNDVYHLRLETMNTISGNILIKQLVYRINYVR